MSDTTTPTNLNNVENVAAGKPKITGAVFYDPTGSADLPTDATTALDTDFVCCGYVSQDGVTNTPTKTSTDIKAWGGDTVLSDQTDYSDKFKMKLIEVLNGNVLKAVYGSSNVSGSLSAGMTVTANSEQLSERPWVIEMVLRGAVKRISIPLGKITEIGDIAYKDGEPIGYEITITAAADASGNTHYEYIKTAS